jgi:hypothetical protein
MGHGAFRDATGPTGSAVDQLSKSKFSQTSCKTLNVFRTAHELGMKTPLISGSLMGRLHCKII